MLWQVAKQLVAPLGYLSIRTAHHEKVVIDWVFPIAAAATVTAIWTIWPSTIPLRGDKGMISSIGGMMQLLVGFYVATLAAIATFPSGALLDQDAHGMTKAGKPLRRRQFLASLFGYLAFLGLLLLIFSLFRQVPVEVAARAVSISRYVAPGLLFVYLLVFWQMVFVTLLGLFYLTDRIHRQD